jgi:aminotransferase
MAAATALGSSMTYFEELQSTFQAKSDFMLKALQQAGFETLQPQGGYFIMADWRGVAPDHIQNDVEFVQWLITEGQVACIPPSAFYRPETKYQVKNLVRVAICKTDATLNAAVEKLQALKSRV